MDFPIGQYGVVYADPPWAFRSWSDKGRNRCPDAMVRQKGLAERHYKVMTINDIADLPVESIAADNCALFMWTVDCNLPDALEIGKDWGFKFKTVAFSWVKTTLDGSGFPIGLGYWTRGNPEQCLLFTKGAPKRKSAAVRQLLIAPRKEHSAKPPETYERIEALLDGPYIEIFARNTRPGWSSWGDQL
jgi:N6-adenosine-specific RNA methylase IME4